MVYEEEDEAADRKLCPCRTLSTATNPTRSRSNQVGYNRHGYSIRRECSKAQMCLQKILHIISSNPRQESRDDSEIGKSEFEANTGGSVGFCIDCNMRLGASLSPEYQESAGCAPDGGSGNGVPATEKSSEGECEVENVKCPESAPATATNGDREEREHELGEDYEVVTEKTLRYPEISNFHVQNQIDDVESKRTDESDSKRTAEEEEESETEELIGSRPETASYRGGDCLFLLIEAARLILGDSCENESDTESTHEDAELNSESEANKLSQLGKAISGSNPGGSKRKVEESWMVVNIVRDMEDRSPVVRSKRGRSQVLPCRYRDSVLEPWRSQPLATKISRRQRRSRF